MIGDTAIHGHENIEESICSVSYLQCTVDAVDAELVENVSIIDAQNINVIGYNDSFDDDQSIQLSTLVNEQQGYEELETPTSENIK